MSGQQPEDMSKAVARGLREHEDSRTRSMTRGCGWFLLSVIVGTALGFLHPVLGLAVFFVMLFWSIRHERRRYVRD